MADVQLTQIRRPRRAAHSPAGTASLPTPTAGDQGGQADRFAVYYLGFAQEPAVPDYIFPVLVAPGGSTADPPSHRAAEGPSSMAPVRPFPVDPVITAIAIGYRNQTADLIADAVMPRIRSWARSTSGPSTRSPRAFTVPDTRVGRRGRSSASSSPACSARGRRGLRPRRRDPGLGHPGGGGAAHGRPRNIDPENLAAEGLTA